MEERVLKTTCKYTPELMLNSPVFYFQSSSPFYLLEQTRAALEFTYGQYLRENKLKLFYNSPLTMALIN
jgi:hypothetical protein